MQQQKAFASAHMPSNLLASIASHTIALLSPSAAQTERAEATAAMFTRDGEQGGGAAAAANLYEMQATWYEVAGGRAYLAQKQYGKVRWCGGAVVRWCGGAVVVVARWRG